MSGIFKLRIQATVLAAALALAVASFARADDARITTLSLRTGDGLVVVSRSRRI